MKAEVTGNVIEFKFSASDILLLGLSTLSVIGLTIFAGWQVAFVALGLSLLGTAVVDAVQQTDD